MSDPRAQTHDSDSPPIYCSECERRLRVNGSRRGYRWQNHANDCSRRGLRPDSGPPDLMAALLRSLSGASKRGPLR